MAEEIIISDLEQAPLLTDDMVLAVEDTKNTYSATLGQLRELINKLFVEKENIDFNTLTDDGFYQVSGTLTNAPVAGSITWIVQVVKVGNVIVQNAMATDASNYKKQLVRRYNGTSWESWEDISANSEKLAKLAENNTFTGQNTFNQQIVSTAQPVLSSTGNWQGGNGYFINSVKDTVNSSQLEDIVYHTPYTQGKTCSIKRTSLTNKVAGKNTQLEMVVSDDGYYGLLRGGNGTPFLSGFPDFFITSQSYVPTIGEVNNFFARKDLSNATAGSVTAKIMPDYNAGVSKTVGTEYTATEDCIAIGYDRRAATGEGGVSFYINGVNMRMLTYQSDYTVNSFTYLIPKGATYKAEVSGAECVYSVYPLKGAK